VIIFVQIEERGSPSAASEAWACRTAWSARHWRLWISSATSWRGPASWGCCRA